MSKTVIIFCNVSGYHMAGHLPPFCQGPAEGSSLMYVTVRCFWWQGFELGCGPEHWSMASPCGLSFLTLWYVRAEGNIPRKKAELRCHQSLNSRSHPAKSLTTIWTENLTKSEMRLYNGQTCCHGQFYRQHPPCTSPKCSLPGPLHLCELCSLKLNLQCKPGVMRLLKFLHRIITHPTDSPCMAAIFPSAGVINH